MIETLKRKICFGECLDWSAPSIFICTVWFKTYSKIVSPWRGKIDRLIVIPILNGFVMYSAVFLSISIGVGIKAVFV